MMASKHPGFEVEGMSGYSKVTDNEREALARLVPKMDGCQVLEIGTYMGATAAFMATANPQATIVSVDIVERPEWRVNARGNQTLMIMPSRDIPTFFQSGFFDMIFIDGDHSYEGVKNDLYAVIPLLKEGGVLICHDYETREPVKRAVDEYCKAVGASVTHIIDTMVMINFPVD